jgi:hypothetical protein
MSDTEAVFTFAWCFDHGRLHKFHVEEGAWCTAAWVPLEGSTEEDALMHKQLTWGDAQFFDQLTLERQGGLINMTDRREKLLASKPTPLPEGLL